MTIDMDSIKHDEGSGAQAIAFTQVSCNKLSMTSCLVIEQDSAAQWNKKS